MKILIITCLSLITSISVYAQPMEGKVVYERTSYWTKIYSRLTYLSKEEKDRIALAYSKQDGYKTKMELLFSPSKSLYTYPEETENSGEYSWSNSEHVIFRDFDNARKTDIIELIGKTYIIEDSLIAPKWKILNEIKEIQGQMCMKAQSQNTVKGQTITAWFADNLPVSAGPDEYFGLPGLILELDINDGDVIITATNVEFKPVNEKIILPRKMKGRKINTEQYNSLINNHIKTSIKAYRNPYWSIPY